MDAGGGFGLGGARARGAAEQFSETHYMLLAAEVRWDCGGANRFGKKCQKRKTVPCGAGAAKWEIQRQLECG